MAKSEVAGLVVVGPKSIPYLHSHCEVSVPISSFIEQGQGGFHKSGKTMSIETVLILVS